MSTQPPPLPVELFLLNPKNRAFVEGRSDRPEDENPLPILLLKMFGLAVSLAFCSYWLYRFLNVPGGLAKFGWLISAGLAVLICTVTYWTLTPIFKSRRFLRACTPLWGELIKCQRVDDDGTIDWRVTYRFHSPSGQPLEGKWTTEGTVTRVDNRPDPKPGCRVAIAYIDDRMHRML
jgi:hypothetical protein